MLQTRPRPHLPTTGPHSVTFTIPVPPSVNGAFANVPKVGRIKTEAYKQWLEGAGWTIRAHAVPHIGGVVEVEIKVRRPQAGRSDIDNRIKATLDLMVKMHVIDDDRMVRKVSAEWSEDVTACEVTVTQVEER